MSLFNIVTAPTTVWFICEKKVLGKRNLNNLYFRRFSVPKIEKNKLSFSTEFYILSSNFLAIFTKYFIVINFTVQVFSVISSTPVSRVVPTNSSTKSGRTGKLIQGHSGRPDLAPAHRDIPAFRNNYAFWFFYIK